MTDLDDNRTMMRVNERREVLTYNNSDGDLAYIGVWVDGIQIAAVVRQDEHYAKRNRGARWSLWSSGLSMRALSSKTQQFEFSALDACPLPVMDEHDARAWLALFADLAECGPRIVEERRR